jgi:phosphopantothenoylcysteine decarboxylase / phosphopantothenate---cysteine ligase
MHPSVDIKGTTNQSLDNKRIVLCITGSVAAVRAPEIARELMRMGAEVFAVMTHSAAKIIHPDLMHWATGHPVVTELTGAIEHVSLAGNSSEKSDLIVVAPATANTIGKIACGIDDTPVTTFVTTALGEGIPLVIVPAMHESMYDHPIVIENIAKLKKIGVQFVGPVISEGKAKIADTESIVGFVETLLSGNKPLAGKNILITAGPTIEYIDPVRVITNRSSGKMGIALASAALSFGAKVKLIYGPGSEQPPHGANVVNVDTAEEMHDAVMESLTGEHVDVVIAASAVCDFRVKGKSDTKIPTSASKELKLTLEPTPKIIDEIKKTSPNVFLVAFRAVTNLTDAELVEDAFARLKKANADLIVANDVERKGAGFMKDTNEVFVIDTEKNVTYIETSPKQEVAKRVLVIVAEKIGKKK